MNYIYKSQWDADALGSHEDCGPACVVSVAGAFGVKVLMNEIRTYLGIPATDATSASQLVAALTHFGVPTAKVWTGTGLPALPAICLVKYSGFDRAKVWDKNFLGWHFLVVLSVSDTMIVCHDPDFPGNLGALKQYSRAEFDKAFIVYDTVKYAVTWQENKVSNLPTTGVVRSDIETEPKFIRVRDGANSPTVVAFLKDGATVSILGSANDTKGRLWYQVSMQMWNPVLFSDEALTKPALAQPFNGWCAGWLIAADGSPPAATFSIDVTPATIQSGQAASLKMDFKNVGGAWLNDAALDGSNLPIVRSVNPSVTTTYTLKVQVGTGFMTKTATLTVSPVVVPPPQTVWRNKVGINFLFGKARAQLAFDNGCRDYTFMNDYDSARWACDALGKTAAFDGKGTVMFRYYWNHWPSADEVVQQSRMREDKRIIYVVTNECEFNGKGGAEEVQYHASLDMAVAALAIPLGITIAAGTYPVGNPDITKIAVVKALHDGYATWWNTCFAKTGIHPVWDQHEYSPSATHIYSTQEGYYTMGNYTQGLMAPVGVAPRVVYETVGRNNTVVARLAPEESKTLVAAAPASGQIHIYENDWYESRVSFLFKLCGFNLLSGGVLMSSETGCDVGGKGGFPGNGLGSADVLKWIAQEKLIFQRPVTDMFGNTAPLPKESADVFQGTDTNNGQGGWASYYVGDMIPDLKPAWA